MPKCVDVADYFLSLSGDGEGMSNLKVQKLVYYAQGFSLALLGRPIFDERIEAWMHGPVAPALYREFSKFGAQPIPLAGDFDPSVFSPEQMQLLDEVFDNYGHYSAWQLRQLTHDEDPWRNNYLEGALSREIPLDEMQEYFKQNLVN